MTPDRWEQARKLYLAAAEMDAGERSAFLHQECAGDDELRREVEGLLDPAQTAGSSLEDGALNLAAQALARHEAGRKQFDLIGHTLAHYRVVEKIGRGGQGDVYRARDEHLPRDVAVKILPAGAFCDEESRKRFRKEAQALAKLSHPNIETIYDFDSQDGIDFLAAEYIQGRTLRDLLSLRNVSELEITRLGEQLAEGLAGGEWHPSPPTRAGLPLWILVRDPKGICGSSRS